MPMPPRIILLSLTALVFLLAGCSNAPQQEVPAANVLPADSFAIQLADIGERLTKAPNDASLYAERSDLFITHDSMMPAMNDMVRAVSLDSGNAGYRVKLGDLFWFSRTVDQAQYQFEKALQYEPKNTTAMLKLAEIQLVLRQYQRCLDLSNQALRIDSRLAKGYFIKGWVHKETGDTSTAISSYHTAVEMDPQYYDAFIQLGLLHQAKGDPLAQDFYDSALRIRPNNSEALYNMGMYQQETGNDSAALACYARIAENDPSHPMAHFNTGFIHLEHLDDPRGAITGFTGAIERLPNYYQAYFNRGLAYERLGVLDSAGMDFQRALVLAPDFNEAAYGLERLASKGLRIDRPGSSAPAQ